MEKIIERKEISDISNGIDMIIHLIVRLIKKASV